MPAKKEKNSVYKSIEPSIKRNGTGNRAVNTGHENKVSSFHPRSAKADYWRNDSAQEPGDLYENTVSDEFSHRDSYVQGGRDVTQHVGSDRQKKDRRNEKDLRLLTNEPLSYRPSHRLTYAGLFLFTFILYFRPYELIPALSVFSATAWYVGLATLLIYLPTQIINYGSVTVLNTETKCILFLAFWALITIPLSTDPVTAWSEFTGIFIKVVIIFIIMVNTLRTKVQLKGLMYLGIATGLMLSYQALVLYREGKTGIYGDRVSVDFGGMFGNPNDMALHFVIFAPIALCVGLGLQNRLSRLLCYTAAALMVGGNFVTQSRGGFLGLLAVALVLIWKLGRGKRFKVLLISLVFGLLFLSFAPGDYGTRIISIFVPSLDPVGSSDQRRMLLEQSIWVTLRNPAGIGIGNFPIVGSRNLVTHNAYTQISAELGWIALISYLIFLISPLRKLAAVGRQMIAREDYSEIYYLSIGLQAGIVGYMVTSFFASVAYQWYIYFPVAFAICLRQIYRLEYLSADSAPIGAGSSKV